MAQYIMGVKLTKKDVLDLLNSADVQTKLAVTHKVCHGYNAKLYSMDELAIAEEIFRALAKNAEVSIRQTLSVALKLADDLPRDIAKTLAQDVAEVSLPMLEFSKSISDTDLLEIIYTADVQKLLAISRRPNLTGELAVSLADKKLEVVTVSVLCNDSFTSNKNEFESFLDKCPDREEIIARIVDSATLPVAVSEKLLSEYSAQILKNVRSKYNITPIQLDKYISHSLEITTLSVINHKSRDEEIEYLVNHLFNFDRLTSSMILSAACMGRRRFFISALAKRAGITKTNAHILLEKGGREGVHALLKRAGIPDKLLPSVELVVVLLNEKKNSDPEISVGDYCKWLISKLEYFSDTKNNEFLSYMVAIAKQTQEMKY